MSDTVYFIPILSRALQDPELRTPLNNAFKEIKEKGTQKRYTEGYKNFELFMHAVQKRHEIIATDYTRQLIAELATRTFEGTPKEIKQLMSIIRSHPLWRTEYRTIRQRERDTDLMRDSFPTLTVLGNKGLAKWVAFKKAPDSVSIDNIVPGNYKIKLVNTGWIIWEGELTAEELIWSAAYKGKDLSMAAETETAQIGHTNEMDLLNNGELILRTFAGIENGTIEIELTR